MTDLKVGDEVRVFNGARSTPETGWPGEVTRTGRMLIDIRYCGRTQQFRMDTRRSNEKQYGYGIWFETVNEAQDAARRRKALAELKEFGISVSRDADFTAEQIEALVNTARRF
jgi:hypothetical protein